MNNLNIIILVKNVEIEDFGKDIKEMEKILKKCELFLVRIIWLFLKFKNGKFYSALPASQASAA